MLPTAKRNPHNFSAAEMKAHSEIPPPHSIRLQVHWTPPTRAEAVGQENVDHQLPRHADGVNDGAGDDGAGILLPALKGLSPPPLWSVDRRSGAYAHARMVLPQQLDAPMRGAQAPSWLAKRFTHHAESDSERDWVSPVA